MIRGLYPPDHRSMTKVAGFAPNPTACGNHCRVSQWSIRAFAGFNRAPDFESMPGVNSFASVLAVEGTDYQRGQTLGDYFRNCSFIGFEQFSSLDFYHL